MHQNIRLFLIFFIAFTAISYAQQSQTKTFNLDWTASQRINLYQDKTIDLPLVKNNGINQDLLPTFSETWNDNSGLDISKFSISNVKSSLVSATLPQSIIKQLTPDIKPELKLVNQSGQLAFQVYVVPFFIKNNTVYKVDSFTLQYSLTAKSRQNNTTVAVQNSVLATGTWYKFAVDTTGVFKLDVGFLKSLGINTSNLSSKNIRIFGNGGAMLPQRNGDFRYNDLQENAIYVDDGNDGTFNNNDYILFYAKGPNSWTVNPVNGNVNHVKNIYSDKAYYFITVDQGEGKRITDASPDTNQASTQINTFNDYFVHELDETNLFSIGQQWFGESLMYQNNIDFNFDFNDIDITKPLTIKTRAVVSSSVSSQLQVTLNNNPLYNINFSANLPGSLDLATANQRNAQVTVNSEKLDLNLSYNSNGNPSARAYLDFIEILGIKHLTAHSKQFGFRSFEAANTDASTTLSYQIANADNIFQLWDVSDFLNPKRIQNQASNGNFEFNVQGGTQNGNTVLKEYQVLNQSDFYKPITLKDSKVANQNLHGLKDIDYLILTNSTLIGEASRLADYHQKTNHYNTAVVDIAQVYNEFGSGSPDITALRDFIHYLYTTASDPSKRIKYVCLFGDTSFDYKNHITDNNNVVPAFESFESFNLASSYVTDDYFGMMDDDEGTLNYNDKQDVATGRYPVTTVAQAKAAVDKTLNYYSSSALGDWRNLITVVADDPDKPSEFILEETVDNISKDIRVNKPVFNIKKIYADAYKQQTSAGGQRYPDVNTAITDAVENGTLLMDYFGHGGEDGWANERILEIPQIQNWYNPKALPLFITVTCEFAKLDNPLRLTAGEYVFNNPNGGGISLITTTREIYISVGQAFNQDLIPKLLHYKGENYTIAQALMAMKNDFTTSQRLFVYFFGDPAMPLAQAPANIKITKMNGVDVSQATDTLKALSHVSFEGVVTDTNNQLLNNFNGTLSTTVYDKPLDKSTLDNDNFGKKLNFTAIESKIYRGRASVTNGTFKFEFVVPKDIRIAYGKGKMSFYADNGQIDKSGYNFDFTVGGIDKNAQADTQGPQVSLFMNDESFLDGGNTNQSPYFIADLQDDSGINTSLTAVDHDLIAILDNDDANPIILNDYYQTELNDYKKGKVKFQLRDLTPGPHQIKFKAWDTYNNLSEASLSFNVVTDKGMTLAHVLNYPNPFVNYTEFWFEHNRPNEPLNVQVQIFTISGKLVKTINKTIQTTGNLSREITWDGRDDFGAKLGKGVYIYKLKVASSINNDKAEKTEKLVILR